MRYSTALTAILLYAATIASRADTVRLACTADTGVSSYATEQGFNYGKDSRLRLKGIEMIGLFQFDTTPIAGWHVEKATLFLRQAGDCKLRTMGLSTISAPWEEGTGSGEAKPGETCFLRNGAHRWAGRDTDFTDVSFTAGNTLAAYADITVHENGWISVPIDLGLVHALQCGATYGLAVSDEKGQTMANNDVYSREQNGSAPYLLVERSKADRQAPERIETASVRPDAVHADFENGAVLVTVTPPAGTFCYSVTQPTFGAEPHTHVVRARIPFATPGKSQSFFIPGLSPGSEISISVTPISEDGAIGATTRVSGTASPAKVRPAALQKPVRTRQLAPIITGPSVLLWAYPDTEKTDAITGRLIEERDAVSTQALRPANSVWSGHGITLYGARSEVVGFNLMIEKASGVNALDGVEVHAPKSLKSADGHTIEPAISLFREWYVKAGSWLPEACIPLDRPMTIPAADNKVPGQQNQSVFIDLRIPADAAPGTYTGSITVTVRGQKDIVVPLELTVNSLRMPDALSFDISLNTYGTFGGLFGLNDNTPEYRAVEREFHRMAYAHRSTLAPLGYSHTGNITTNYAPIIAGEGANMRVTDWSAWDRQFGSYLDGSAFADLGRRSAPISHLYLPFHEAWPVDIRKHYTYTQTAMDYPAMIAEHAMKAEPFEDATDQAMRDGFTSVAADFANHFREKGWTHTMFQFYQNDKYYYKDPKQGGRGTSWWLLDEPNHRDDWLVLAFFNRLFAKGVGKTPGVDLVRREDISRPQWQRDYLDGLVDLMCVSGELFTKGPRLREMHEKLGVTYWNYGSANPVDRSNIASEAWAVRAWLAGADAIVPWQSIGEDKNFDQPEETALLLPGTRFGIRGPIASIRLKALRRAQQDVEYLAALAKAKGWDREQVAEAVKGLLKLSVTVNKADDNDAGSYRFGPLRASYFDDVRRAIGAAISK